MCVFVLGCSERHRYRKVYDVSLRLSVCRLVVLWSSVWHAQFSARSRKTCTLMPLHRSSTCDRLLLPSFPPLFTMTSTPGAKFVTMLRPWQDALLDDVMLGFRLKEGLDLEAVATKYGCNAVRRIEEGVAEGLRHGWVVHEQYDGVGVGVGVSDGGGDISAGGRASNGGSESVSNARSAGSSTAARVEVGGGSGGGSEGRRALRVESGRGASGGLGRLRLSDPEGFLFSNSVISSVFCELDGWKRIRQGEDEGSSVNS